MAILESAFSIMVKSVFTVLISFCTLSSSFSQPGFNVLKNVGFDKNHIRDMIVVNDTIIGYGFAFDSPVNGQQGLLLAKFDSSGTLLHSRMIIDSLGDKFNIDKHWGKITSTLDGGFAMTAAVVGRNSTFLIKTDSEFDIEFIKEYPDSVNIASFQSQIIEIADGYILYGTFQGANFFLRPYVRKVDKQGNTIWFKYYGSENASNLFNGGDKISDSLFVFGGVAVGATSLQGKSMIQVINADGDVMKNWTSPSHPDMGFLRSLKVLDDENILLFGQYLFEGPDENLQPTLSKINVDFEFDWIKRYGRIDKPISQIRFWDMEPLYGNEFIGAGQSRIEINGKKEQSGWLMKFNTEGDSIWSRYDFPDFPVDSLGDTYFGGVGVLSSGSIVAGGTATLWNERSIWLVKVTTDGCLEVINCGLVPTTFRPEEEEGMVVYPNPANGEVSVKWEQQFDKASLRVYDLQGKIRIERAIENTKEITLNTVHLSGGIYYVEIRDRLGHLVREKLLVLH